MARGSGVTAKLRLVGEADLASGVFDFAQSLLGSDPLAPAGGLTSTSLGAVGEDLGRGSKVGTTLTLATRDSTASLKLTSAHVVGQPATPGATFAVKTPAQGTALGSWGILAGSASAKIGPASSGAGPKSSATPVSSSPCLQAVSGTVKLTRSAKTRGGSTRKRAGLSSPAPRTLQGPPQPGGDEQLQTLADALGADRWVEGFAATMGSSSLPSLLPAWQSTKLSFKLSKAGIVLSPAVRAGVGQEVHVGASADLKLPWAASGSRASRKKAAEAPPRSLHDSAREWAAGFATRQAELSAVSLNAMWMRRIRIPSATLLEPARPSPAAPSSTSSAAGPSPKPGGRGGKAKPPPSKGALETATTLSLTRSQAMANATVALLAPPFAVALGAQVVSKFQWPAAASKPLGKRAKVSPATPSKAPPSSEADSPDLMDNPMLAKLGRKPPSSARRPARKPAGADAAAGDEPDDSPSWAWPGLSAPVLAGWASARCDIARGHSLSAAVALPAAALSLVYRGEWKGAVRPHPSRPLRVSARPLARPGVEFGLSPAASAVKMVAAAAGTRDAVLPVSEASLGVSQSPFRFVLTAGTAVSLKRLELQRFLVAAGFDSTAR